MKFNAIAYFENIARQMKAIGHTNERKHFFRASNVLQLQELIQNLTAAEYPALVIFDKRDGRYEDHTSNNLIDRQIYQLLVLVQTEAENSDERHAAIERCNDICRRIISRMTRDWLQAQRGNDTTGLRNLDRNNMYYNSVGPLVDNLFGMELVFVIREPVDTSYEKAEWADSPVSHFDIWLDGAGDTAKAELIDRLMAALSISNQAANDLYDHMPVKIYTSNNNMHAAAVMDSIVYSQTDIGIPQMHIETIYL